MSKFVEEGGEFESIEEVDELMESIGYIASGVILQPEEPFESKEAQMLAEDAELQIADLEIRYGEEGIALVPSPPDEELDESIYMPGEHKLVYIKLSSILLNSLRF